MKTFGFMLFMILAPLIAMCGSIFLQVGGFNNEL